MKDMKKTMKPKIFKTDEEYIQYLKTINRKLIWLPVIGFFLLSAGLMSEFVFSLPVNDHSLGFCTGIGFGLIIAGIALTIKHKLLFRNKDKLKKARLETSDERIRDITRRAFLTSAVIMLAAMYVAAIIGGLFYPILNQALCVMIGIFFLSYLILYNKYDRESR